MTMRMYRNVLKWPRRSIAELLYGSVKGKRHRPHLVESFQTIAGLTEPVSFGYNEKSITNSLGHQIVNALQLGHRNQASDLLSVLKSASKKAYAKDVVQILDYCARSPDPLFVMETWRTLEGKNIKLSKRGYTLIVRALCRGGYLEEALHLVKYLQENCLIDFILPLYNTILSACATMKDTVLANQCLNIMDNQLLGRNEWTYTILLKLAVWEKNLSAAHDIWKEYIKYYNGNIISLKQFIWAFTRLKDLESAHNILQHIVTLAVTENTFLFISHEDNIFRSHYDIPIPSNGVTTFIHSNLHQERCARPVCVDEGMMMDATMSVQSSLYYADDIIGTISGTRKLKNSENDAIKRVLKSSFNDVILTCAYCRNSELAEQLIMQMQNLGLELSSRTYDGLVRAVIWERGIDEIVEIMDVMKERNVKPCDSTLSILSVGCSKALDLDFAEALLNGMAKAPYAHPYNVFLAACDVMDQPERAVKMFAKMRQLKIKPVIRTYELLFSLFGNVNFPYEEGSLLSQADVRKRIKALELDMLNNGIQHSCLSVKNLLRALGKEGMVQELLQYLRAAEQQFPSHYNFLSIDMYNTVMHTLIEVQEDRVAIQIFRNLKLRGLHPNAATYTIMIDCCSNIKCFKSACALVSLMMRDGFLPQTVTYTALIKIVLEYNAFDDALDLLEQTIYDGNEPDVLLFNTVLRKADTQGRIDVIELMVNMMHKMKIQPDPSTCSYVFNAYVQEGYENTAIEALQVLSLRMISLDPDTIEDVRNEYEDLILSEEEVEMKIIQLFTQVEKLASALLNLRWCSILGSSISWAPDQIPWAKRLASTYATLGREAE